jgi:small-conductance mechanosensitive channel/CRP-like cAMP-binding protein
MVVLDRLLSDRPELLALAILLLGVFATRWSVNRAPATRLVTRVPIFLAFTYFLFQAHQVPYLAAVPPTDALARILGDSLRAIWWFWAASIGSNAVREFSFRGSQLTGHRFFTDICVASIYVFAFVGLITFVLNFPVQGILVTSGAVAVVLGRALQSSLGDVFYGIVLNLGKPYKEGDWISLDNGVEGRVLEMNWRATHMLTTGQDVIIVPNSVVAKSKIINSSFPSHVHGTTIAVLLAPNTFPMMARRLLNDAIQGCPLVLSSPPPAIVIKSMSQEAIAVEITFFTSEIDESPDAQNQVYEKIFRCLGAAGIGLGSRTTALEPDVTGSAPSVAGDVERLVAFTPVFSRLPPSERSAIAASMVRETFEPGTTVIECGVTSEAMYVVGSGVLSYTREIGGREVEITRMTTADHFGAGGLLGGSPTVAKVSALTLAVVYRLEKKGLMRLVEARPGFAAGLNRELAARKLLARDAIESHDDEESSEESLANWFSNLFRRPNKGPDQQR